MRPFIRTMVFFGECMLEHRADGSRHFGGDTFNTAWYLASLIKQTHLQTINLHYATAIGCDRHSQRFAHVMKEAQIGEQFVERLEHKTMGQYWITVSKSGERSFRFERAQSAAREYFNINESLTLALTHKTVDTIYLSGISLAILCDAQLSHLLHLLSTFKKRGGIIFFDNNYRPTLWRDRQPQSVYQAVMTLADIAFLTLDDEFAIHGTQTIEEVLARYRSHTDQLLVIRQGALPCIVKRANDKEHILVEAESLDPCAIVDTCAAGDAFAAGFIAKWLSCGSQTIEAKMQAAQFAHKVAAIVIQHHGALIDSHQLPRLSDQEATCA